jgi:hypothetical protein
MSRMKKLSAALALLMIAVFASESAWAHGRRGRIGIGIGFGFGAPYYPHYPRYYSPYYHPSYYYPPYYYSPPPVTYIERPQAAPGLQAAPAPQAEPAAPAGPDYWFFCRESNAYYPYVGQCASGWERVPARPQN